jgi:hypothetical protein
MNFAWKACDPIGLPKIRSPFTSSYGWPSFLEYWAIASSIWLHRVGFSCRNIGTIDSELVDAHLLVDLIFSHLSPHLLSKKNGKQSEERKILLEAPPRIPHTTS